LSHIEPDKNYTEEEFLKVAAEHLPGNQILKVSKTLNNSRARDVVFRTLWGEDYLDEIIR